MRSLQAPLKVDDVVQVIAGREKGKSGKVLRVIASSNRVVIEKLNIVKRHQKPSGQNREGGIVEKEAPMAASNVMIMCPACVKPVRVKSHALSDGKRARACHKCGELLDK